MIGNQKVVQAFSKEEDVLERFEEINGRLERCSLRATFFSSITNPATRFVNSLVYTGVGITGAFAVLKGFLTVGQLSSFLSYANQYTKPFNEISGVVTELQNALACAARIFELIEEKTPGAGSEGRCGFGRGNGKGRFKGCKLFLYAGKEVDSAFEPGRKAGAESCHCRAYRLRKDHSHQSAYAVL